MASWGRLVFSPFMYKMYIEDSPYRVLKTTFHSAFFATVVIFIDSGSFLTFLGKRKRKKLIGN